MLDHRLRRWANMKSALVWRLMFAGEGLKDLTEEDSG